MSTSTGAGLSAPYASLFMSLHPGITGAEVLGAGSSVAQADTCRLVTPLQDDTGKPIGTVVVHLAEGADAAECARRIQPAIDCLTHALAATEAGARANELRLLRLANELDLHFADDHGLDKALAAVALRTGVELAWLAAPRCLLTLAARGYDHDLDPGVARELGRLRARVAPLTGKLRRPLSLGGPSSRPEQAADSRLLLVPLFVGRGRHNAWLVLANPLAAPAFGGWQVLAAMTLGQALARRLEVDLDRRTGLFNRGGLEAALPRLGQRGGSVVLLDIDRLQSINQVHGMAAGDVAIMSLAGLLAPPLLPASALVARTHGDQFAIVLPAHDANQANDIALRIQGAASAIQPGQPDDPSPMTLSAGIVEIDDFHKPFDRFAIDADTALKLAKDRGRSRIEVFSSGSSTLIRRNDEVIAAADLREALRDGALLLFAQPIRLLADRSVPPSFELLIRMRDESGEIIAPGEFMAAAQRFQLLPDLDRYVVDAALRALSPHRGMLVRLSSSFSVNVSGQSLADERFTDHFIAALRASRVPAALITVEITEQAAITHLERAARTLVRLREAGCGIAIDDFGTGASALAYLRTLPVTRLKIDGTFVRDILTNRRSEAGVKGILQLAREYQLDTVAEYIENEPQAARLQALGVQRGQGYLFGRPIPVEMALRRLAADEQDALRGMLAGE
jgi:diguanylate cyclase (GGDEF)-like protein